MPSIGLLVPLFCLFLGALKAEATAKPNDTSTDGSSANLGVSKDFKDFSEEVASRIDRIVKKKAFDLWNDPWTIQGIPLIFPSTTAGFNLGLRVAIQNIRRQDPHKFELEAQVLTSDLGRYKHFVKVDIPHAFDGKFRVTSRLSYDRDIGLRYYGIGNNTPVDLSRVNNDDPLYQNVRSGPGYTFQILRYLGPHVSLGPIVGFKWTQIYAPSGSLLAAQRPLGLAGGRTHYLGAALVYDTTDFEPYPSRGLAHELYGYWYAPFIGSDYNFWRFTYTFRHYYPLHRDLIFAYRAFFESLSGNIPFYELGSTGGARPTLDFGGSRFLRGYDGNRFIDRLRFALGMELRWDPLQFLLAKQDFSLGLVPFFDVGRVWPTVFPLRGGDFHASGGFGARLIWSNRFILRMDMAVNPEGESFYVDLGNSF